MVLMGVQVSVLGLYLPPVLRPLMRSVVPPQTIISLPVHTTVGSIRPSGAFVVLVGVHVSSVQCKVCGRFCCRESLSTPRDPIASSAEMPTTRTRPMAARFMCNESRLCARALDKSKNDFAALLASFNENYRTD